ncbi:uncharacterized protein LOC100832303 [Brachypodium distachyon]|uniref:DUF4378 domain-containing protein n=1 Tax=Brachypodium distachyon TaxID=15368 RepID=I1IYP3_BRADI|nr:uncharacterized protein LOC100832303 [Brachypodium distachyon]KQJ83089.1 hypothetical protein BRADI_5g12976v3 [Brachypodium distachyon]KQJ83099.2 hypothetical protein BRADI_5g12976v3 [Brachypodium distachyon]|eukprot:XP_010240014.1 uncharacterized protein LOC100832303 [Brachypodium distachyon]
MDVERAASKGHGIFGLFDWGKGKKSKKRLFTGNGGDSPTPGNTVNGKEVDGSAPSTPSNSMLEDAPSLKESSEHSSSSSVIGDEAHTRRGPTVVARLMGLDSMPEASSSGSCLMPITVQQSFQNNVHGEFVGRSYFGSPSSHKMPSSPIDRFRMEALPPRFAKRAGSVAQHKLFSPVKNPNHISSRNAADIMEAASRIIGPGVENSSSYRVRDVGYSTDVRAFNPSGIVRAQQMSQAAKKRDCSASSKQSSGKPVSRSLVTSETSSSSRVSQSNVCAPFGPKVKASSRPSPDSRGTNAQGREGISKNSRKLATRMHPEHNIFEGNGCNQQKSNNNQKDTASSSNVLVQNNRKRNAIGAKQMVNSKSARLSQQQSNMHSTNASPRKAGITSTRAVNSMTGNRNGELQQTNYANRRHNSTAKTIPKPRRLPDGRMHSKKSQSIDKILAERIQKRVQHNIGVDEQSSFSTNKKKISTDIVSFTFTSPVHKSLPSSQFRNHSVESRSIENVNSLTISSDTSNTKPDDIDGDYLGLLLEQKLRELTSRVRPPYAKPANGVRIYAPSPASEDTASASETSSITSTAYDRESLRPFKDGKNKLLHADLASKSGQSSQGLKYDKDFIDQVDLEHLHLSQHSTWETSLSAETGSSAESWRNAGESRFFGATEGAETSGSAHEDGRSLEVDDALSEYSDTASSITGGTTTVETLPSESSSSSCQVDRSTPEIDFLREILNASSLSGQASSCFERSGTLDILDLRLLEELNGNLRPATGEEEQEDKTACRTTRRLLFDCANELLSAKCAYYLDAGYCSWFTGTAVLRKLSPEELYREMTGCCLMEAAEESMVDELVYREMGGPRGGSWVGSFKMESFEAGRDVAAELLESLVNEMVADLVCFPVSCGWS